MPKYCAVKKCTTNGGFKFPKDPQLKRQWLTAIKRELFEPKDHSVVCAKHFKQEDFKKNGVEKTSRAVEIEKF